MSLARFISQKLISQQKSGSAQPIVWIAKGGIVVGMMMMIISISLVNGFQKEIQRKLTSFGGHLNIHSNYQGGGDMSTPFERNDSLIQAIAHHPMVKNIKATAHLPAILESKSGIQGTVLKGVENIADSGYLKEMLVSGRIPYWQNNIQHDTILEILISQYQSQQLEANVGDKISVYFLSDNENPQQQNYRISGIFESGLEEFDRQIVFMSLPQVLKYSNFGIEVKANVDSIDTHSRLIRTHISGAKGTVSNVWKIGNNIFRDLDSALIQINDQPVEVTVIVQDDETLFLDSISIYFNPITAKGISSFDFKYNGGSSQSMVGNYEIELTDMESILKGQNQLYEITPYYLGIQTVTEKFPEIISWLNMLDINVIIIIVMMIAICIINMTSALLIIIIERQQMIGSLKAMGMNNKTLIKTFLFQAAHIISRGMLWGNILGILLIWIQKQFEIIQLDPQQYFVKVVPIDINLIHILLLNALVLLVCIIAMTIPAAYSTRIQPIKSIRFN